MPPSRSTSPNRRTFLLASLAAGAATTLPVKAQNHPASQQDRSFWLQQLELVSSPVLNALKAGTLRRSMPIEAAPGQQQARAIGTHLEALGRLLSGLAPWLELQSAVGEAPKETALRHRLPA